MDIDLTGIDPRVKERKSDLSADPHEEAKERGLVVVLPGDDELFVDIDNADDYTALGTGLLAFSQNGVEIHITKEVRSESGGAHRHVYLKVPDKLLPMSPTERVLLQACLGSDRTREVLSFLRLKWKKDRPATVFFEKAPGKEA
jgi:hypothetical protein